MSDIDKPKAINPFDLDVELDPYWDDEDLDLGSFTEFEGYCKNCGQLRPNHDIRECG